VQQNSETLESWSRHMQSRPSAKFGRLAAEFFIVLLGVLGALWVEEFRDWRADRSHELAALKGVANDLDRDILELGFVSEAARRRATGAVALIIQLDHTAAQQFLESDWPEALVDSASAMSVRASFSAAHAQNDFDHSNAAFRELLATGRLETVRAAEVRSAIGAYYHLAEDIDDFTAPDQAVQDQLHSLLIENGIHSFLSDTELSTRLASDQRIEASLHRVARSAAGYSFRMTALRDSAQVLRGTLRPESGRD
jgi:hypothetical protein